MWSAACVLAELLGVTPPAHAPEAKPPLFPSHDSTGHIRLIARLLGPPQPQDLPYLADQDHDRFRFLVRRLGLHDHPPSPTALADRLPAAPAPALDLLAKLLHWDPAKRISAEEVSRPSLFWGGGDGWVWFC
jgi:serine/threonine protein kinase